MVSALHQIGPKNYTIAKAHLQVSRAEEGRGRGTLSENFQNERPKLNLNVPRVRASPIEGAKRACVRPEQGWLAHAVQERVPMTTGGKAQT